MNKPNFNKKEKQMVVNICMYVCIKIERELQFLFS